MGRRGRKIGLFGGSFNPAHEGHLHVSALALDRLGLDEIWWLVSPQNPLKNPHDLAPYKARLDSVWAVAGKDRRIRVSDAERELGTRFTVDTLSALKRRYPGVCFIWIMGADLLVEIHRWKSWDRLFGLVGIAIFDRPAYGKKALTSKAALRYRKARLPERKARLLARQSPPAWVFLHGKLHPASSTQIRAQTVRRDG